MGNAEVKSLQIWLGNKPMPTSNVNEYYSNYMLLTGLECLPYETRKMAESFDEYWRQSDILRLWWLGHNPYTIYSDCDVMLKKKLVLGECMALPKVKNRYDYFIIWNGNEGWRCLDLLNNALKYLKNPPRCWIHGFLNGQKFNVINETCYYHG